MNKTKSSPLKHKEGNIDAHKVSGAYFGEDKFHEEYSENETKKTITIDDDAAENLIDESYDTLSDKKTVKKPKGTENLENILKEYVLTANNKNYNLDWNLINSKFPELKVYDEKVLKEYVATANNTSYNNDYNLINSKFPEFNFEYKPSAAEVEVERTFTGKAVGYWEDKLNKEIDSNLDGLDDNIIYQIKQPGDDGVEIYGDESEHVKSLDNGQTFVPMNSKEIDLFNRKLNKDKISKSKISLNLDDIDLLKKSTAIENAYRFLPSDKQIENSTVKYDKEIDEFFKLIDEYKKFRIPSKPRQVTGGDVCDERGSRKRSGSTGYNCEEIKNWINKGGAQAGEQKTQLLKNIVDNKFYSNFSNVVFSLNKKDEKQGLETSIVKHRSNQLNISKESYEYTIGFSNQLAVNKNENLFKKFPGTPSEKQVEEGDYYLNTKDGQKYRYINGKHQLLDEFHFQWSTKNNIKRELIKIYNNSNIEKIFQSNINQFIDKTQGDFDLAISTRQKDEIKKIEEALEDVKENAKTNYTQLVSSVNIYEQSGIDAKTLINEWKKSGNRDNYFLEKSNEIQKEFDEIGEPIESGAFAWTQLTYDKYNDIIKKANDFKVEYSNYENLKSSRLNDYNKLLNLQKQAGLNYNKKLLEGENLALDEQSLLEYHNLMRRNGHALTSLAVSLWGSGVGLAAGVEGIIAEVPMMFKGLEGDNALSSVLKGWSTDFEDWRGGVPIMDENGKFTGEISEGYRGSLDNYTNELYNGVELPTAFEDLNSFTEYGMWGLNTLANFAPQAALMWATGGTYSLAILATSAAGSDLAASRYSNQLGSTDYTLAQRVFHSGMVGGAEAVFERYTLRLIKGAGKKIKDEVRSGVIDGFKKTFNRKSLTFATSSTFGEGISEFNTTLIGENLGDILIYDKNKSLLEGTDEAFWSGAVMARGIAMPGIADRFIRPFSGNKFDGKIRGFQDKIADLETQMDQATSNEKRSQLMGEYMDVVLQRNDFIEQSHENVDLMSEQEVKDLIALDVQLAETKRVQETTMLNEDLSKVDREEILEKNKEKQNDISNKRNKILEQYETQETRDKKIKKYNESKALFIDKIKKYNDRQNKRAGGSWWQGSSTTYKAKKGELEEFETNAEAQDFFENNLMEVSAEINAEIIEMQNLLNNPNTSRADKVIARSNINELRKQQADKIQESKDGANSHGFIVRKKDGSFKIVLNKQIAINDQSGNINVAAHEFLHSVLYETIGGNPQIQKKLGDALLNHVKTLSATKVDGFNNKLNRYGSVNKKGQFIRDHNFGEETIVLMSESILDGSLEFNEGFFTKIGDLIRQNLQRLGVPGWRNIKFNTGKDVYNFIKDYNASIKKNYESKAINKMMDFGARGNLVDGKKVDGKDYLQLSKSTTSAINELGNMGWDNKSWKEQGADFAIKEMKENRMLDGLIRAQYKTDIVPPEFVDLVYSELVRHVRNFNPEKNNSLFGWINSQLSNKAGNVYNREFKKTEQEKTSKDIDSRTKEGETKVQVAAKKDIAIEKLETEDLSISAQIKAKQKGEKDPVKTSKFRKQLGIETGGKMYDKVLNAVRKTFGTMLPSLSDAKLKKSLTDNFKVELKTPVANLLGTKQYESNLRKHREAIVNAVSTADWVQVERLVPDKDKIFTKFVRKLTKIQDVQDAVDQDLLPPSALNIIRKGTAVSFYEKVIPTQDQFLQFYNPPGSIPSKKDPTKIVRSGLKGTRKDILAEQIGASLGLDATMQVVQEPEIQFKREQIAELKGEELTQDDKARLSEIISRPSNVQFSKNAKNLINLQKVKIEKSNNPLQLLVLEAYEKSLNLDLNAKEISVVVYNIIEKKLTHLEDKALLAGIMKGEVVDNNYFDGLMSIINKITVRDTRTFGYKQSVDRLKKKVEKAKDNDTKADIVKSFLINEGKWIRTLGPDGEKVKGRITTNDAVFNEIIKDLGIPGFKSVEMKTKSGKTSYFVNKKTGKKKAKTKIQYKGEDINTYKKVTNIKTNFKLSKPQMIIEAESAVNYVIDIVTDLSLTSAAKKSIIKGGANQQEAFVRKMGVPGVYIEGLKSKETTLDHNPTINDLTTLINETIDGKMSVDVLKEKLKKSTVNLIPKEVDEVLNKAGLKSTGEGRMDRPSVVNTLGKYPMQGMQFSKSKKAQIIDLAILNSRLANNPTKGISILDFDDTLATTKSMIRFTRPDGTKGKLNAEQYAATYENLLGQNYKFDFSEFTKVVKGKTAPLFKKALKLQEKFGSKNMFVLTARPAESAVAIHAFLKANGLNIPLKNITGLANSTADAKALWVAEKVGEGYNDFYFADDALQNVEAVKNMLNQFDVKSKVQQAKIQFSKSMSKEFNRILQNTTKIQAVIKFSDAQAKLRGRKTKYKGIIPASAQDFMGLLYNFVGKGKKGEADIAFFKKALVDPFARGIDELNASRQTAADDFKNLLKKFKGVKKLLNKKIEESNFTYDQAVRVYLWNKAGFEVPGLSKKDLKSLSNIVKNNADLLEFAESVGSISKTKEGYFEPSKHWLAENINSDLLQDGAVGDARSKFLNEWQENADQVFSPENLNKIEAIYGAKFREALEDVLYRMKTGRNRPMGGGRLMNMYMNWVNNSVGAIMFFNMRSALLQTISATNYINWSDNNPLKAAAAFANQKQFWSDFTMLFNSDYLKQRRSGNRRGVNEAELSAAVAGSQNKAKAAIAWLLQKGFLPTQIADSFAIASGGASFYRNRVNSYIKQGMSKVDAEAKAFLDFQETTEVSQQSARPDLISQQQASPLGRLILSFQNTPMQYARIMNKAARDLVNGRGDFKTHISKIIYYSTVQGIIFGSLQSALFAALGDEDEEKFDKKKERILNQMIDSVLSGIGYGGKAISTVKNTSMEYLKQRDKGFKADHAYTILQALSFSPPIGSKLRKIYSSIQTERFNKDIMKKRGFSLDNPIWSGIGNVVEGVTNVPLGRLANKMRNIDNALDSNNETWQRLALVLGWSTWDLGIKDQDLIRLKEEIKTQKKETKKIQSKIDKKEKDKETQDAKEYIKNNSTKKINESLFKLKKDQQVELLTSLGLTENEINNLDNETFRIKKIVELQSKKDNAKKINEYLSKNITKKKSLRKSTRRSSR